VARRMGTTVSTEEGTAPQDTDDGKEWDVYAKRSSWSYGVKNTDGRVLPGVMRKSCPYLEAERERARMIGNMSRSSSSPAMAGPKPGSKNERRSRGVNGRSGELSSDEMDESDT